jgi:L-lysine 2,3-aminomutase
LLLKHVNDTAEQLCELSERLFSHGIIPYYLHLLDKANGTGHFDVTEQDALALMRQVQATLPGYLVPKLVKEVAGMASKQYVLNDAGATR